MKESVRLPIRSLKTETEVNMIVFEVYLNGKRVARAGADDLGVLTVIVNGVGKLGSASKGTRACQQNSDLFLSVGGLTSRKPGKVNQHLGWISDRSLKIGDEIPVKVKNSTSADKPCTQSSGDITRWAEKKNFQYAKQTYFRLRGKYEGKGLVNRSSGESNKRHGA